MSKFQDSYGILCLLANSGSRAHGRALMDNLAPYKNSPLIKTLLAIVLFQKIV